MTQRPSILIVDDEPIIRSLLLDFLGQSYDCCAAADVSEASSFLGQRHFDLAIVDILMPGESGLELCDLIRQFYPDTRSIVLSAVADVTYVVEATRRGALSFARKPCDLPYLSRLVDIALRHRIPSPESSASGLTGTPVSVH